MWDNIWTVMYRMMNLPSEAKSNISKALAIFNTTLKDYHAGITNRLALKYSEIKKWTNSCWSRCKCKQTLKKSIIAYDFKEKNIFHPFDYDGFTNILKLIKDQSLPYKNLQDFDKFVPPKKMKAWNLLREMKKVLLQFFPVMALTYHEKVIIIPVNLDDTVFMDWIDEWEWRLEKKKGRLALYEKFPVILDLIRLCRGT